ncbi:hypothetical protein [Halovivax cerinus]|uniref:DUF1648 domain-containing protein n=1 Tax=Halovivax cerinus TaxID=1487865 RepID=A0ABD5NRJ0_9EURY|nr:hypothetical protein [Halovivax cerinus]
MSTERPPTGRRSRLNPATVTGPLLVLTSIVTSLIAARVLGPSVRIRWSVGTHYGPEYASTGPVMLAFTVTVAGAVVTCLWIAKRVAGDGRPDARLVIELVGAAVGALLVATQVLVVGLNL